MKILVYLMIIKCFFSTFEIKQNTKNEIDWNKLSSFRIYFDTSNRMALYKKFSERDILNLPHKVVSNEYLEQIRSILKTSVCINNPKIIWKNYTDCVAFFNDGSYIQLIISGYGGFYLVVGVDKYYLIEKENFTVLREILRKFQNK